MEAIELGEQPAEQLRPGSEHNEEPDEEDDGAAGALVNPVPVA